ncbi:hypothetical protein BpHYR1_029935 [Brachionus plicatilis]|uniref:Uncharacterized protein n=1 Tax=Brachionus plicatilis TaxID=10195 RepID=A0A3M7QJU8_BRAPC|nr:hypothetical protein BpHYR1_029935 [Brachionus plicatilis]
MQRRYFSIIKKWGCEVHFNSIVSIQKNLNTFFAIRNNLVLITKMGQMTPILPILHSKHLKVYGAQIWFVINAIKSIA